LEILVSFSNIKSSKLFLESSETLKKEHIDELNEIKFEGLKAMKSLENNFESEKDVLYDLIEDKNNIKLVNNKSNNYKQTTGIQMKSNRLTRSHIRSTSSVEFRRNKNLFLQKSTSSEEKNTDFAKMENLQLLLDESLLRESKLKKQIENKMNNDNIIINEKLDNYNEIVNNFKKEIENKKFKIEELDASNIKYINKIEELNKILKETQNALITANEQIKKEKILLNKMKEEYDINLI
jgi:hypothetical protein